MVAIAKKGHFGVWRLTKVQQQLLSYAPVFLTNYVELLYPKSATSEANKDFPHPYVTNDSVLCWIWDTTSVLLCWKSCCYGCKKHWDKVHFELCVVRHIINLMVLFTTISYVCCQAVKGTSWRLLTCRPCSKQGVKNILHVPDYWSVASGGLASMHYTFWVNQSKIERQNLCSEKTKDRGCSLHSHMTAW